MALNHKFIVHRNRATGADLDQFGRHGSSRDAGRESFASICVGLISREPGPNARHRMPKNSEQHVQQSAVIPFRRRNGQLEVLLITSSRSKRWVIPKGDKETELSPRESAAREALEEAGIEGPVSGEAVGTYAYEKGGDLCRVRVFAMAVEVMHEKWQESFRRRRWLDPREAARRVNEKGLKRLLRTLPEFVTAD